jgi:hypothetical protein
LSFLEKVNTCLGNKTMKYYIFLSSEGTTITPKNINIENLQVLGFSKGSDKVDAYKQFIVENMHLQKLGFQDLVVMELANETQIFTTFKSILNSVLPGHKNKALL